MPLLLAAGCQCQAATAVVDGARSEFHAEHVLVATGRRPVTDGLNLDAIEVKVGDRRQALVGKHPSSNPRIWAADDVAAAHGNLVADGRIFV